MTHTRPSLSSVLLLIVALASGGAHADAQWRDLRGATAADQVALLQLLDREESDAEKEAHAALLLSLVTSPSSEVRRLSLRLAFDVDDEVQLRKAQPALKKALEDPGEGGAFAAILWARSQPRAADAVYTLLRRGSRAVLARDDWVEQGVVEALAALDPSQSHPLFEVILRQASLGGLFHKFIAEAAARQKNDAIELVPALKAAAANGGAFADDIERAVLTIQPPSDEQKRTACLEAKNLRFRALEQCIELVANGPMSPASADFFWRNAQRDAYVKRPLWAALAEHGSSSQKSLAVARLKERLHDKDEDWRDSVARMLPVFGAPGVAILLDDVRSTDEMRIVTALKALGETELGPSEWKPICWRMVRHPAPRVRSSAAIAIKRVEDAQQHVQSALRTELDDEVRVSLWRALVDRDVEIEFMRARLKQLQPSTSSSAAPEKQRAADRERNYLGRRLRELGPRAAPLANVVGPHVVTDGLFASALVAMGPAGWAELRRELFDPDVRRRRAVLESLRWVKPIPAVWGPALSAASHDVDAVVRQSAFRVMASLPPSVDVLWHVQLGLGDERKDVRTAAFTAFLKRAPAKDALLLALHSNRTRFGSTSTAVETALGTFGADVLRPFADKIDARVEKRASSAWMLALHKASPKRSRLRTAAVLQHSNVNSALRTACDLVRKENWSSAAIRKALQRLLVHRDKRLARDAARALMRVGNSKERQQAAPIAARKNLRFERLEMP